MERKLIKILAGLCLALAARSVAAAQPATAPRSGAVIYSDDFRLADLHRYDTVFAHGNRWLNGESEIYVDPSYRNLGLNPFSFDGGVLTISAQPASPTLSPYLQGKQYTSGLLTTFQRFSHGYGYYEVRARLPAGKGTWPAFWLLPVDTSWPPEIDAMEAFGDDPSHYFVTVHYSANGQHQQMSYTLATPDLTAAFHDYGVLWTANYIAWYFDSNLVAQAPTPPELRDTKVYMLLNLAIGGKWAGQPDASTRFPARFQVACVRVYSLPSR